MMQDRAEIRRIFDAAVDLPRGQRQGYVERECAGRPELLARVLELLASDSRCETFLEAPVRAGTAPVAADDFDAFPVISDAYRIREQLGAGGMGVVYGAEQLKPVRRRVAVKVIRRGMDSEQVLARFEAEKAALGMMDHPCIAKVFDAGLTADGRPYFVMEFAAGLPVTDYCDRHRLSARERLELFVEICGAIQHAHQKGIIHRDIKPTNVLVSVAEGKATPKVIDFGVAKAIDHRLAERTLFTELGQLVGTPEYMSPEQAEMSPLNVDTRTDIYSLGVLLYELLSGTLPFSPADLRSSGFDALCRKLRDIDPPRPSTRISRLKSAKTGTRAPGEPEPRVARPPSEPTIDQLADRRRTDARGLLRALRGDLDWITMKALEKDRTRRYDSASAMAADVLRHLRNEPVTAGPPGVGYRAKKFILRNRVGVAAAGLVVASLVVGIVGTAWGLLRARDSMNFAIDEANRADLAYGNEQEARKAAQAEAANARFVASTSAHQAAYASRRLAEMLPFVRRGVDTADRAPQDLVRQYPEAVLPDSKLWIERLLPELTGPGKDAALAAAVLDCGRASAPLESGRTAVAWAIQNRSRIDALLQATESYRFRSAPEFGGGESQLWQATLPEIDGLRAACAALSSAAVERHLSGDPDGAVRCLEAQRRVAISASYGGMLVSVLSEYVWRQATYQHLRWFVSDLAERGKVPAAFRAFVQSDRPVPSPGLTTVFDGLALRQVVAGLFVRASDNEPPRVNREVLQKLLPSAGEMNATLEEMLAADYTATMNALDAYDRLADILGRASVGVVDSRELESLRAQVAAQPLLRSSATALERSMRSYVRLLMEHDATILTLALCEHRAAHGRWPDSVAEALKASDLRPLHTKYLGLGFVYRVRNGKPLLYHPGFDRVDNDGTAGANSISEATPDTDIVFLTDAPNPRPTPDWLAQR